MTVTFELLDEKPTITPREAARRRAFPKRITKPMPTKGHWHRYFDERGIFSFAEYHDLYVSVSHWLNSEALRLLNLDAAEPPRELTLAEIENWSPQVEQIADTLYELYVYELPEGYVGDFEKQTREVAQWALDVWRSDFLSKLSAAGRKGGQLSKRGKKITVEDLARVEGKSISIQAKELGCTPRTISRRRAELALTNKPSEVSA